MKHLTEEQRYDISAYLKAGFTKSQIAVKLHVHKSTITREIQRNGYSRFRVYKPRIAQHRAEYRWLHRKLPRRFKDDVRQTARELLERDFSPEQIVGYCRRLGIEMVSHETLYKWIWEDKRHHGELYKHLRHRGRRHSKRSLSRKRRGVIPNRVDISERPAIVDERIRYGDMEIDTIVGSSHGQHILTVVDRAAGTGFLRKLGRATAEETADQLIDILRDLARMGLVKTITADNGLNFAAHERVAKVLGIKFYFARPYHSWERGTNENFNGLVRQYIPKGTNFDEVTEEFLNEVERALNDRPRERYDYSSPRERFAMMTGREFCDYSYI
jgi:IS30 family transposase